MTKKGNGVGTRPERYDERKDETERDTKNRNNDNVEVFRELESARRAREREKRDKRERKSLFITLWKNRRQSATQ